MNSSKQYPGSYFYLHAATQTSQWERPTDPPNASLQQEEDLMAALERAQGTGNEKELRQILAQLNAKAASMAVGQPEPQPEPSGAR